MNETQCPETCHELSLRNGLREGPDKIGTILIKSEHLRSAVQRILQSADENQPPYRPIERSVPDVHRRVPASTGTAIECGRH